MAFVHGKGVVSTIDGDDLSAYSNSITFTRTADTHDVTTFGRNAKVYQSGLTDGTASVEGIYDSTALVGPGAVFRPLLGGLAVPLVYRPEGTGAAKPEAEVDVVVSSYEESAPANDMITWTVELQFSGAINDAPQS
jgi:hypothetical protein